MSAVLNTLNDEKQTTVVVKTLTIDDRVSWDNFVEQCPQATFFHRSGWSEVIERTFGHDTYFLYAEFDGAICGVLPLAHVRSLLFGNALISGAFAVYGGIAASSTQAQAALQSEAQALATRLGVDYLEMRNQHEVNVDWPKKDLYVTFRKEIDADPDANLKAIPRKQRAMVRKAIKSDLVSVIDSDSDRLFDMYSESVRNLGTPVFSSRYFKILMEVFGDDCDILTIENGGQSVSSVMNFYFRDEVLPYYGGGIAAARRLRANDFMYWELMRLSGERGIRIFDYGRSKQGTGSYSFKKNWGFEPEPLHYEFFLVNASEMPDINPLNPKYQMFIKMWKKLPLPVSRVVGPRIARCLG